MEVNIDVEYCGSCGHYKQFLEMQDLIKSNIPSAEIKGTDGRQASFEIQVNQQLVYSKLQTLAFPDFGAVKELIEEVAQGGPIKKIEKQQPIECTIT